MVRTRSGKASTEKENAEAPVTKTMKSPKKTSSKKLKKSINKWTYQIMTDLCIWKPTDKTFNYWMILSALMVLVFTLFTVHAVVGTKCPDFCYFSLVLAVHCFDILTNFCNELLGNNHLDDMIYFTECAVNLSDIFLLLFITNTDCVGYISIIAVIASFIALKANIRFQDHEKYSMVTRVITYIPLTMCFAIFYQFIMNDERLMAYFTLVLVSMIFDVSDFPDNYFAVKMCEGSIIFSRAAAIYILVTAQLLSANSAKYTNIELAIKSLFS